MKEQAICTSMAGIPSEAFISPPLPVTFYFSGVAASLSHIIDRLATVHASSLVYSRTAEVKI